MAKAHTTYKVKVGRQLTDEFGQTLGKPDTRTFDVGDAYPQFFGPQGVVVLDPAATKPTLDVFTTNYTGLDVKLYAVQPSDLDAYNHFIQNRWNHDHPPSAPGKKVFDDTIKTSGDKNELAETHVDLSSALDSSGPGHGSSPWWSSRRRGRRATPRPSSSCGCRPRTSRSTRTSTATA